MSAVGSPVSVVCAKSKSDGRRTEVLISYLKPVRTFHKLATIAQVCQVDSLSVPRLPRVKDDQPVQPERMTFGKRKPFEVVYSPALPRRVDFRSRSVLHVSPNNAPNKRRLLILPHLPAYTTPAITMNYTMYNPFSATPSRSLKRSCDHLAEADERPSKFVKRPVRLRLKTLLRLKKQQERWGSQLAKASAAVDPMPIVIPPIFRRHPSEAFFDVARGEYAYSHLHTVDGQDTDMALADVQSEFQQGEIIYNDAEMVDIEDVQEVEACPHIDELAFALNALNISYGVSDLVCDMESLELSPTFTDKHDVVADNDYQAAEARLASIPIVKASRSKAKDDKENLAPRGGAAASSIGSKKKVAYPSVNFIDFQDRPALQSVTTKAPPVASPPYHYCQYFTTAVSAICGAVAMWTLA
ncbi:hypothetical protein R3P38DRAFT_3195830 [Favolaschia claudopus]|uniref:Uncharacterized protein n=1 Tax=Favolaschia claudopus TaxID=2862362 RepID=A0AAW0B8F9_9AGAR